MYADAEVKRDEGEAAQSAFLGHVVYCAFGLGSYLETRRRDEEFGPMKYRLSHN